jgi:hypothetical protein
MVWVYPRGYGVCGLVQQRSQSGSHIVPGTSRVKPFPFDLLSVKFLTEIWDWTVDKKESSFTPQLESFQTSLPQSKFPPKSNVTIEIFIHVKVSSQTEVIFKPSCVKLKSLWHCVVSNWGHYDTVLCQTEVIMTLYCVKLKSLWHCIVSNWSHFVTELCQTEVIWQWVVPDWSHFETELCQTEVISMTLCFVKRHFETELCQTDVILKLSCDKLMSFYTVLCQTEVILTRCCVKLKSIWNSSCVKLFETE